MAKMIYSAQDTVTMNPEDYDCQICGKKATQFVFAAFCCADPNCVNKAMEERGGPGGHMKRKEKGLPVFIDTDEK